jgi:hypothetical protein
MMEACSPELGLATTPAGRPCRGSAASRPQRGFVFWGLLMIEPRGGQGLRAAPDELVLGAFEDPNESGVEILALDRGRGIADVASCLVDGHSSAGPVIRLPRELMRVFRRSVLQIGFDWWRTTTQTPDPLPVS